MQARHSLAFEAIGTHWIIDLFQEINSAQLAIVEAAIMDRIEAFDLAYSRFRPDSLVSQMAVEAGRYQLPDDAAAMIAIYHRLYDLTDGAMTPLIGQTLSDAGYDASYSLRPKTLVSPPRWEDVMVFDAPHLELARPALLDFGAAGKGYLVDLVAEVLLASGVTSFCVNAGGDLVYRDPVGYPLPVALEHPADPAQAIGIARLNGGALCGSAGNRRTWEGYHHVIDPHALRSPRHLAAVWVTAASALLADALTTALFFVEPEVLLEQFEFEWAIVRADNSLVYSGGFPAEFFD